MTPTRTPLPNRRPSIVETISFEGNNYDVSFGVDKGEIREVFITSHMKQGSSLHEICEDAAVLISLLLQYDFPRENIAHSLSKRAGGVSNKTTEPASIIGAVIDRIIELQIGDLHR